jgi:CTP synthase
MTKYLFCTGGVVSSVGKGVTAAAIGRILRSRGVSVAIQKLDPYLNVDPGTMSPYQHGEVYVLDDGAETDLDLGHYERFIDESLTQASNVTSGQVYAEVIARERRGDYLGGTIQVIPHVTNEIKRRIAQVAEETRAEVVIVEVGGTVGDIEGLPFLEAIRQMRVDLGRDNTVYLHVTWMPYIESTGELKTKPTQHSVRELRGIGIQPDVIVARSDHPVDDPLRDKIALFCDVQRRAVIPLVTTSVLYEIPLVLEQFSLGDFLVERLKLEAGVPDVSEWQTLVDRIHTPRLLVRIGLVGKYVELQDAYLSVREALYHAGVWQDADPEIIWIDSEDLERTGPGSLEGLDGIVVPGGFGYRGIEGKVVAARYARKEPNSTEFDLGTKFPVIDLLPEQRSITDMGGTMRLGLYPCRLVPGTRVGQAYGVPEVQERHRHRFEVNNAYRPLLSQAGMLFSGLSPDGRLVEIAELEDHPWMVGCQFHPEFRSRPNRPHPLFLGFIEAVLVRHRRAGEPDSAA